MTNLGNHELLESVFMASKKNWGGGGGGHGLIEQIQQSLKVLYRQSSMNC